MTQTTLSWATLSYLGLKPLTLSWCTGPLSGVDGTTQANKLTLNVDIVLNETVLGRASGVYIAALIIHEALHAFMWGEVLSRTGIDYRLDDPKLFDEYTRYNADHTNGTAQHNMMADNYRDIFITAINAYDRSFNRPQRSTEELQALSWRGLEGTGAWKDFAYSLSNFDNTILANSYLEILSKLSYGKETNDANDCTTSKGPIVPIGLPKE